MECEGTPSSYGIDKNGIVNPRKVFWNLSPAVLVEHVVRKYEGELSPDGAVMVNTGHHTGRSPNDKFLAQTPGRVDDPIWWGKVNRPLPQDKFDALYHKIVAYLQGREVYVQDLIAGADPEYALPIRVITEKAWTALFSRDLFIRPTQEQLAEHIPQFTVLHCPDFFAIPEIDGTLTPTFITVSFERKLVLIGGTAYAGEVKKSIFTVMNYLLPLKGVLSMHCSANVGASGDVALFFGLSGTGKTTLSSDPERQLIGDDEHGWSDTHIFNFEGGCYAKTIRLNPALEPIIWSATHRFGSVLENVVFDPTTRDINFDDESRTENTRGAYPLDYVPNHVVKGYAGHPDNIFFLTADAFGVMPPLAKLTPEQAMYYFLSGYTSKLAGTERGLGSEPEATFSTCFGAPFLPLHPSVYAKLLGEKIARHNAQVWLINTGWTGGPYGIGSRIKLPYTRSMIRAALTHQLDKISLHQDEHFGLWIPDSCPEVPADILNPQNTWKDQSSYHQQANNLVKRFVANFAQFADNVTSDVVSAGPKI